MAEKNLKSMYRTMQEDPFPAKMEIAFINDENSRQIMVYEKATWTIDGEKKGLRYGENPDQPAALYRLVNGNLVLGEVHSINPGLCLASDIELLQSGKHPGKINVTDADAALNILKYFTDGPCVVIVKHNNPCGVACGETLAEAYTKALAGDRIAAFGGAVALNGEVDRETAEMISESYVEVVAAPGYAPGSFDILSGRKNLRIMRIENIRRLSEFENSRVVEYKSLIDGGIAVQWSYVPAARKPEDLLPAEVTYKGATHKVKRAPSKSELEDMIFGWLVESGVTSNSVLYVKDQATVAIGTGEQDRVGVAEMAKFKAMRNTADRLCWELYNQPWLECSDPDIRLDIEKAVDAINGGLQGSVMISDAFFPKRDGIEVGLKAGVSAVLQPGGSIMDHQVIDACNDFDAAMMFTGQRSFKH
ncbi:MAG: IMP cyclohydrolase [Spirochaetales bacterium]|jgi:phosphoribosylaminoimidazolecarboxamide formyltransferase / IMP cyclohydrolase|nr:IMP cyclohydrolase [Spirochaetales bacterium]